MRTEIGQQAIQLDVLNNGLRQQLIAPVGEGSGTDSNEEIANHAATILDPLRRARMLSNVNPNGIRVIYPNITGRKRASPVKRYNAMLQHLHQLCHGPGARELTAMQLQSRRHALHRAAKKVVQAILVLHPGITLWKQLKHLQQEQLHYSLEVEDQVLRHENLLIGLCQGQWCARLLLSQGFKAVRMSEKRSDAAVAAADAAANAADAAANAADAAANAADAAAPPANSSSQENQATGSSVMDEALAAGAQVSMRSDSSAQASDQTVMDNVEDDDNLSTTSNM